MSNNVLLSVEDDVSRYQVTENITRSVRQWGETEEEGTDQGLLLHCHQCLAAFNYPCVAPHLCYRYWLNMESNLLSRSFMWIIYTTYKLHILFDYELGSKSNSFLVCICNIGFKPKNKQDEVWLLFFVKQIKSKYLFTYWHIIIILFHHKLSVMPISLYANWSHKIMSLKSPYWYKDEDPKFTS